MRPSKQKVLDAFEQKANQLLSSVSNIYLRLEQAAANADGEMLSVEAKNFAQALVNLEAIYPANLWPSWLQILRHRVAQLNSKPDQKQARSNVVRYIFSQKTIIDQFDWKVSETEFALEIDQILEAEFAERNIESKFDDLIKQISEIVTMGKIDDQKVHDDLTTVLSMVRAAKVGNFGEKLITWQFVRRFISHFSFECAKSVPGIKQSLIALEKTSRDLDVDIYEAGECAVKKIHSRISTNLHSQVTLESVPTLLLHNNSEDKKA